VTLCYGASLWKSPSEARKPYAINAARCRTGLVIYEYGAEVVNNYYYRGAEVTALGRVRLAPDSQCHAFNANSCFSPEIDRA
jgi:hypothetical protein